VMDIGEQILRKAPDLGTGNEEWEENRRAFWRMHSELLAKGYEGKWVAVYQGKVVDSDADRKALIKRVFAQYGIVPAYFQLVLRDRLREATIRTLEG
ncbi:MAG: DUF5678 domain-containing protein, partial [Armatimonadota bacterium]